MRIIKPYGTTGTSSLEDGERVRRIHPDAFRNDAKDVLAFATSHPKLVLAQWISMIDKIITKPQDGEAPSLDQYNLREEVGSSAWQIIQSKHLLDTSPKRIKRLEREWWSKIHPYGGETAPTGALDFRGRWFSAFSTEADSAKIDGRVLADALYEHLYSNQRRLGKGVTPLSRGLIVARSQSIAKNTLREDRVRITLAPPWSEDDITAFAGEPSVVDSIAEAIRKYEGQRAARSRWAVGQTMHRHYARLFQNAEGEPLSIQEASDLHPGLFALHEGAKSRLRRILNAPQVHWRKKLPSSVAELVEELQEDWRNRKVNELIRLGKIIHYQGATHLGEDSPGHVFIKWSRDVSNSRFWCSDGQTDIKRYEAFVRVWRHALSFASRSVTNWADPHGTIERDILGTRSRDAAIDALSVDDFDRTASVLFGRSSGSFATSTREYRQAVLALALTSLNQLRNAAFHFGGLTQFIQALHSLGNGADNAALESIRSLYVDDTKALSERLAADLGSIQAEYYLRQDQMDAVVHMSGRPTESFNDLPNFRSVLRRGQTAHFWRKVDFKLPPPASATSLDDDMARHCQRLILKLLYERAFGSWLIGLPTEQLREYVDRYTVRATNEARRISGNDKLIARAAGRIKILDGDTIFDLFSILRNASAAEKRDAQKARARGRDLGKYLRDLELDIVAQAFQVFVDVAGLSWVFDIKPGWRSDRPQSTIPEMSFDEPDVEDWQCVLYFLLHLVPVNEVNKLSHQISRSSIHDGDQARVAAKLLRVSSLYESNHDLKFEGLEGAGGRATLQPLFESDDIASYVLDRTRGSTRFGRGSIRGLREMLRFGPPRRVIDAMAQVPITRRHKDDYEAQAGEVAASQTTRARLHEQWVKNDKWLNDDDIAAYSTSLKNIIAYRTASHHIHLTNHLNAHRLLISSLAKLIDYAGVWERDLYFVTLAILYRSGVSPDDVFSSARSKRLLGRGQIIEALRQRTRNDSSDLVMRALETFFGVNVDDRTDQRIATRNELVHFGALQGSKGPISVTDLVNRTRYLTLYDRKRSNRVSVSIAGLFDSFGLALAWTAKDGVLTEPMMAAKKIYHLGTRDLMEPVVGQNFLELVQTYA